MAGPEYKRWFATFSSTGDICPIRLGMGREDVKNILGKPDDKGGISSRRTIPAIWVYEGLEFHFDYTNEYRLSLIYRDDPNGMVEISIKQCS